MSTAKKLYEEALALNDDAREELAWRLLASLREQPAEMISDA